MRRGTHRARAARPGVVVPWLVGLWVASFAATARAEEPGPSLRPEERAVFDGRWHDLTDESPTAASRWLLTVRDLHWRPANAENTTAGPESLDALASSPEATSWPYLRLLLSDRAHRLRLGSSDLPDAGPLSAQALRDPEGVVGYALALQRHLYGPADESQSQRARTGTRRAACLLGALVALALLCLLTGLAGVFLGRPGPAARRTSHIVPKTRNAP